MSEEKKEPQKEKSVDLILSKKIADDFEQYH